MEPPAETCLPDFGLSIVLLALVARSEVRQGDDLVVALALACSLARSYSWVLHCMLTILGESMASMCGIGRSEQEDVRTKPHMSADLDLDSAIVHV